MEYNDTSVVFYQLKCKPIAVLSLATIFTYFLVIHTEGQGEVSEKQIFLFKQRL